MDYKDIIEFIRLKDKRGIETLYDNYGKKLYSHAIIKWDFSEDEAWEAVYKTLDTLLLKLPGYAIESDLHFNNLVFKIFKNYLRQHLRDKRRKEEKIEFVSIEKFENIPAGDDTIAYNAEDIAFTDYYKSEVLETSLFTNLKIALEKLDPSDKELLLLRAQNYSYDEIANLLNIKNDQLKVKYFRAKKKLVEMITEQQKAHI
jgi:RNA polymerase sigma-70 factor (ECF subfamily)